MTEVRRWDWYCVEKAIHWHYVQHMGTTGLAVYVGLCYQLSNTDGVGWIDMDELTAATGVKSATLNRMMALLERLGLVAITSTSDGLGEITYEINLLGPRPDGPPPNWKTRRISNWRSIASQQ